MKKRTIEKYYFESSENEWAGIAYQPPTHNAPNGYFYLIFDQEKTPHSSLAEAVRYRDAATASMEARREKKR